MGKSFPALAILFSAAMTAAWAGPVNDAAKSGDLAALEKLLQDGGDANETDGMASPLHWAAMKGYAEAVTLLAENGAALDAQSDMLGTPLHAAVGFGNAGAVEALLAAGADVEARDREDYTPLIQAVIKNKPDAARALLAAGADVNAVSIGKLPRFGNGPLVALQIARDTGQQDVAGMLVAAGAIAQPPDVPADLAAMGDAARGKELAYTFCYQCHTIAAGDEPKVGHLRSGPPLIGIIGRPVADAGDFEYSEALIAHGGDWTPERFYAFALSPMLTVPGTKMNWAPDRTPQMIADITAYFVAEAQ